MFKDLYLVLKSKEVGLFLIAVLVLNFIGLAFSLYKTLFWYDILLHLLGGAWVAIFVIYWPKFKDQFHTFKQQLIFTILVVMVIGVAWEIMEIYVSGLVDLKYHVSRGVLKEFNAGLTLDTGIDLIMDLFGGLVTSYIFLKPKTPACRQAGNT